MSTPTELFIAAELPKRPYTEDAVPFAANRVLVTTGIGLGVEAGTVDIADYATISYVDGLVLGLWDDRGSYTVNASGNIAYPSTGGSGLAGALLKGDIFTVTGAVVGVSTINNIAVNTGDTVRALIDSPSTTNDAHWAIAENNIGYVPENAANKTTNTELSGAAGTYPDTPTVKSYIDNYDISAAAIGSTGTVTLSRTASDLTFQVPTALSDLTFNSTTGVLTMVHTNSAADTTVTLGTSADKLTTADMISDQLISGLLPAAGILANTISEGVAYVQGIRVHVGLTNKTWTANRDTYVDLSSDGVYTYVEVANGAGVPAVTALNMRIAKVVSGPTTLGTITMLKAPALTYGTGSGALIYGVNNTLIGKAIAPIATTAYGNTIVGSTQCTGLTSGYENVVIGAATPLLNTGYQNVVIGKGAGNALTTSQHNVLIGLNAGAENSTALNGIVAIGAEAANSSTGPQIVAIGQAAGSGCTTGTRWVAIGDSAAGLGANSDWVAVGNQCYAGSQAVSVGSYANSGSLGTGLVSIGYLAGRTSSDPSSAEAISIGTQAHYNSVKGTGSIAIGARAGSGTVADHKSTNDSYAIYLGWEASRSSTISTATALSNIIAIGKNAAVAASNSCVIGSTTSPVNVGFNMTTPTARMHLPAGTTIAGSAPLKFTSGTNLTTVEAGVIEYDGSFHITHGSTRYSLGNLPFIASTNSNVLTNTTARILGGSGGTASKPNATIITGVNCTANGGLSVVLTGNNVNTTLGGAVVQGNYQVPYPNQAAVKQSVMIVGQTTANVFTQLTNSGSDGDISTAGDTKYILATKPNGMSNTNGVGIHRITLTGSNQTTGAPYFGFSGEYIVTCSYNGTTTVIDAITTVHTSLRAGVAETFTPSFTLDVTTANAALLIGVVTTLGSVRCAGHVESVYS